MRRWNHYCAAIFGLATLFASGATAGGMSSISLRERIANARVGVLFERVVDGLTLARGGDDVPSILANLRADLVFRAWWAWGPCPPDCAGLPQQQREQCQTQGYSYLDFADTIAEFKAMRPRAVVIGAIPAQEIPRKTFIPGTFDTLDYPETWDMALDPAKWGLPVSKKEIQCYYGTSESWVDGDCTEADSWYDPTTVPAYFPDLTDPRVQDFLFAKAKAQIDAGADAIWIDLLVKQTQLLYMETCDSAGACDPRHPAVLQSFAAARALVTRIHDYGATLGREIAVGSWGSEVILDLMAAEPPPALDFVTATPSPDEVRAMTLDPTRWSDWLASVRATYPGIPVITFIDWASTSSTPLGVFSQLLSPEQEREFLRRADAFFTERGILFAYPVHGGYMGHDATVLSYGQWLTYDSMAPEFDTFSTIVQLAAGKVRIPQRPADRIVPGARGDDHPIPGRTPESVARTQSPEFVRSVHQLRHMTLNRLVPAQVEETPR